MANRLTAQMAVGDELRRDERERSMNPDSQTRERKTQADFGRETTTPDAVAGFFFRRPNDNVLLFVQHIQAIDLCLREPYLRLRSAVHLLSFFSCSWKQPTLS